MVTLDRAVVRVAVKIAAHLSVVMVLW